MSRDSISNTENPVYSPFHGKDEPLDRLIPHLAYALTLTTMLSPHKVKKVRVHYYLLDSKRVTDNDNYFDKEKVNGGACWSSPEECEFSVWRMKELLKVSIHELIHGLSMITNKTPRI